MMRRAARALHRARARALALADHLEAAFYFARDFGAAHAFALDLARALDLALDRNHARALALDRDHARALDFALDRALDRASALALDLRHALALDHNHAFDHVFNRTPNLLLDRGIVDRSQIRRLARGLDAALDHVLDHFVDDALDIRRALDHVRDVHSRYVVWRVGIETAAVAHVMPGRAIRGLAGLAVRLLPVAQRPRYREEFSVELAELPRRQRWWYALRVLARAWQLRRALVEVMRTSDWEPVRRAKR